MTTAPSRERWLADTFIEFADTLVDDFDLVDFLGLLVERTVELLDAAEVGLVLRDESGTLTAMASSSERMRALELLELQADEGPCLDAIEQRRVVPPTVLDEAADRRWPRFAPAARLAGYRLVLALPMHLRDRSLGAVNVFLAHDAVPHSDDLAVAQALADAATVGILQQRARGDLSVLAEQLEHALESRVAIEQAKGMIAEQLGIDVAEAFQRLRSMARRGRRPLTDVAREVVDRRGVVDAAAPPGATDPNDDDR